MKKIFLLFALLLISVLLIGCQNNNNNDDDLVNVDVTIIDSNNYASTYEYHVHIDYNFTSLDDLLEVANDASRQIYDLIFIQLGNSKGTLKVLFYKDDLKTQDLGYLFFNLNLNEDSPGLSLIDDNLKLN